MKVIVGADGSGFAMKEDIANQVRGMGHEVVLLDTARFDQIALEAAEAIAAGKADRAILMDASGAGTQIICNKVPGVLAAQAGDVYSARLTRGHNDTNVLCIGSEVTGPAVARACVAIWMETGYDGGPHAPRLAMMDACVNEYFK
nr:RpiB/LacA/LacB family sugar-phosphate isomerase [Maliibacterium massiliense]